MKRSIRRYQQAVAKARRIRILKAHGAWKPSAFAYGGELHDATWCPELWQSMGELVMSEPGWWCHDRVVVPARIDSNRLEHSVRRGIEPDLLLWPDYKKPHDYYW